MVLKELGHEGVTWIQLAQYKVQWPTIVNTLTELRVQ